MCRCLGSQLHHALCGSARLCVCVCECAPFVVFPRGARLGCGLLPCFPGTTRGRRCDFPSSICRASGSSLAGRPSLAPGAALGSNVPILRSARKVKTGPALKVPNHADPCEGPLSYHQAFCVLNTAARKLIITLHT